MAAEKFGICLEAMDQLWFHHSVISSNSPNYSSKHTPQISIIVSNQEISSPKVESKRKESDHVEETTTTTSTTKAEEIPTNLYLVSRKTRSNPSSPTKQSRMKKSMSCCSSLSDLELEEVKGFMDLGFVFKKHNLSSHVISLIPGLQRINAQDKQDLKSQIDDYEDKRGPYLSDSWLVKMPDSPLIRLRISRVCNDSEKVKEHLKDWARTVAASVQQES